LGEDDIAFLQYTSGSTGDPKGVMVTHKNIMSNLELIHKYFSHTEDTIEVSWLPTFHDMGLIGGVLSPLYSGFCTILMSPVYFLQRPLRWLQTISEYKATVSGGPNFAYELCINQIKDNELKDFDLSSWKVAFNGAEPIHPSTLELFFKKFEKYGFTMESHYPCYGMAETTLMIAGGNTKSVPTVLHVNKDLFQEGTIKEETGSTFSQKLVSSGYPCLGYEIDIVDVITFRSVSQGRVGEIWVKGDSVTLGYWNDEKKTAAAYNAYIEGKNNEKYFRTGDLGFVYNKELFICGRVKDLIIIRGKNFYPQDLEVETSRSSEALVFNGSAAFSIEKNNQEQLVIMQEVKRTHLRQINTQKIFDLIKTNILKEFEIPIYDIVLLKPGRLLKTSSGKIQRQANKRAYLNNIDAIASLQETQNNIEEKIEYFDFKIYENLSKNARKDYLEKSVKGYLAELTKTTKENINTQEPLADYQKQPTI